MNRQKIRILFILVAGFLILQFLFILKVSEPYPSIKFPGFGKIPQTSGQIQVINHEIIAYSDTNDSTIVDAYLLLEDYPKTYIPSILSSIFTAQKEKSARNTALGFNNVDANYKEFQLWVVARLATLYHKNYTSIVIKKVTIECDLASPKSLGKVKFSERVVMPLRPIHFF